MRLLSQPNVKILRGACFGAAFAALAGCLPQTQVQPENAYGLSGFNPHASEGAEAACKLRGGEYNKAGARNSFICFETPKDAGKSCSKASDCESACLSRSKTCAPIAPLFGCHSILDSNGREVRLCRD